MKFRITTDYAIRIVLLMVQRGTRVSTAREVAEEAGDITLYDIIEAMAGSIFINRCLQADEMCGRKANLICPVHKIFKNVQSQIINTLSNVRISDLCAYQLL